MPVEKLNRSTELRRIRPWPLVLSFVRVGHFALVAEEPLALR